jgi:hypothetical protein
MTTLIVSIKLPACSIVIQAGWSPNEVIEFHQFTLSFQPHETLGFAQPLTEIITTDRNENISGEWIAASA